MYLFDCNSGEFVEKETLLRSEQNETKTFFLLNKNIVLTFVVCRLFRTPLAIEIFLTIDNRKKIVFLKFDDRCLILVKR